MKTVVIITAMREEAEIIISRFALKNSQNLKNISIFEGEFLTHNPIKIVLVLGGIGKIQAAMATTFLLENYQDIDVIINIGIAGNVTTSRLSIGDVLLPTEIVQHDMYLPFDGAHLDYAKKSILVTPPEFENSFEQFSIIHGGVCATADEFVDDIQKIASLREKYNADVCEMEAFAIASAAREYNMLDRCIFIKAVSDGADNEAKEAHMNNLEFAMNNSVQVLEKILYTI